MGHAGEEPEQMNSFVSGIMRQLLSKDVLHQSMKVRNAMAGASPSDVSFHSSEECLPAFFGDILSVTVLVSGPAAGMAQTR